MDINRKAWKLVFVMGGEMNVNFYTDKRLAKKMYNLFVEELGEKRVKLHYCDCINFKYTKNIIKFAKSFAGEGGE